MKPKGFTLVELLVVIGIMSVLFSIGVYTYLNFQRPQQLENAVTQVKTDLKYTQNKSFAGTKDPTVCVTPNGNLLGWVVHFIQTNTTYDIYGFCGPAIGGEDFYPSAVTLPSSVIVSAIEDATVNPAVDIPEDNIYVLFKPIESVVEFYYDDGSDLYPVTPTPNPLSITLHSDSGGDHRVCIYSNGRIYDTKEAVCP